MTRASVLVRFFALIVDIVFLFIVQTLLFAAAFFGHLLWVRPSSFGQVSAKLGEFSPVITIAFLFIVLYYFTSLTAYGEQTVGKSILGIRVVTTKGYFLSRMRAFLRCICYGLSALPFFLGFVVALIFRGRALHDLLCGTQVVKVHDEC